VVSEHTEGVPANGAAAAAVFSVGIGSLVLGICALAGDASPAVARLLNFWKPTGPLSGVTAVAIIVWIGTWLLLARTWAGRNLNFRHINVVAMVLIIAGLLLTFPPFMDLLQGK
jgi:hypothetical protein